MTVLDSLGKAKTMGSPESSNVVCFLFIRTSFLKRGVIIHLFSFYLVHI